MDKLNEITNTSGLVFQPLSERLVIGSQTPGNTQTLKTKIFTTDPDKKARKQEEPKPNLH
jgi:hypothetical protein